jgi:predicted PhzF superfamily epimerase YddE/YHI9
MAPKPVEVTHTSVFANGSCGGNPWPVILAAADLGPEQMQAIARRYGQESGYVVSAAAVGSTGIPP